MTQIDVSQDGFVVDAVLLATAFDLPAADIQRLMRHGEIMSRCEIGQEEDAGRSRLTFYHLDRAVRFVVDPTGTILKQTSFPASARAT